MIEILKQKNEFLKAYPELEEEINDLAQLALDEIEAGASSYNELSLFISEINNLININS
jgi:hypothetical protein